MPRIIKYCFLEPNKEIETEKVSNEKNHGNEGEKLMRLHLILMDKAGVGVEGLDAAGFFLRFWNSNPLQ